VTMACVTPFARRGSPGARSDVAYLRRRSHLDFRDTGHIRQLLRSMASQLIREEDAFVFLCSGASLRAIDLTVTRSLLGAALARVAGNPLPPAVVLPSSSATDEVQYRASPAPSPATEMLNATP
jgi:hypothetical protein